MLAGVRLSVIAKAILLVAVTLAGAGRAHAQSADDDFAMEGGGWSSVSTFMQIARARSGEVIAPDRIDIGTL